MTYKSLYNLDKILKKPTHCVDLITKKEVWN